MAQQPDLIIIGGGMAGLSAGCYAQMNGYRSVILEAHAMPGGLCTAWRRKGYVFDTSIHMLMSSSSGMFYRMWQELGVVQGREFVHPDVLMRVEALGRKVDVYANLDRLERELVALAPEDAPLVRQLTRMARRLLDFEPAMDKPQELWGVRDRVALLRKLTPLLGVLRYSRWTLQGFAAQATDPFLARVLRLLVDTPGWPMPEMPLVAALMVMATFHKRNAGAPIGGSIRVAQTIARRYRALGGELRCKARVEEVLVEGDRAVGVRLEGGEVLRAGAVLSAADGRTTIFRMLGGRYAGPELRRAYAEWKVYPPLVQVMIGVDRDLSAEPRHVIFDLPQPVVVAGQARSMLDVLHYGHDPSMAPAGKSVVQVWFTSDYDYWATLRRDEETYRAEKRRVADTTLAALEERWPGFTGQVEVVDVATPVTYERYTGNWHGSPDGWCMTLANMGKELPKRLPGLERFYMAGQWTMPFSGVPGAAASGCNAIQLLCKDDGKRFVRELPGQPLAVEAAEFHEEGPGS